MAERTFREAMDLTTAVVNEYARQTGERLDGTVLLESLSAAGCFPAPQQDTDPVAELYPRASVEIHPDRVVIRPLHAHVEAGEIVVRRAAPDAEPVEGELREVEGLHPELHERLVPELRRIARIMDDPPDIWHWLTNHRATVREAATSIERLRAEVLRLRARVQPRKVSLEEWERAIEEAGLAIMQTQGGPGVVDRPRAVAALAAAARVLGLQIEEEGADDAG